MKFFSKIAAALVAVAVLALGACSFEPKVYQPSDDSLFAYVLAEDGESYAVKAAEGAELPETLNLPVEHEGKPVTAVAEGGFAGAGVAKVVIPSNFKVIGARAFADCSALNDLYFYRGVVTIGDLAFRNCSALKKLDLPTSVETLGAGAFTACSSIESVKLPYAVTSVGDACFANCPSLKKVTIRKNVEYIGVGAFIGCSESIKFEVAAANEKYTTNEDYSAVIERKNAN